ncbi:hypothetical protein ACVW0P_003491 [Mucilaginibacter sp. UYNi724]
MKNNYLLYLLLLIAVSSCKLDPVIYPEGVIFVPPGQPGTPGTTTPDPGTDATYTVGIGAYDSFIYQIDNGPLITIHNTVTLDQDPDPSVPFAGNTNLSAHSLDDKEIDISFSVGVNDVVGVFPVSQFSLKSTTFDYDKNGDGTVKFTSFTEDADGFDIIKGYFKVNVVDKNTGLSHVITGSYNTGG